MRFVPDGPDIPNSLILKWREGKVVFLAGAGVSVPSDLPLFDGLALDVYKALKDPMHDIVKKANAKTGTRRRKFLDAASLTPTNHEEKDPDAYDVRFVPIVRLLSSTLSTPDSKRRLSEMSTIAWVWSCRSLGYSLKDSNLRSAFSLANEDVRAAAAWQFSSFFSERDGEGPDAPSVQERWQELGRRFFENVWPLEPTLQSSASANDFARIPASVGPEYFAEVVSVVAPFIVPFTVWSVMTEFQLDPAAERTHEIIRQRPDELLTLLSLGISDEQGHGIYDLGTILDQIDSLHPSLQNDYRIAKLRRFVVQGGI
jgi:hypothetical protein